MSRRYHHLTEPSDDDGDEMDVTPEQLAHHEAGHAVLAAMLGRRFLYVRVIVGQWEEGYGVINRGWIIYRHATENELCSLKWRERRILVTLAGGFAQRRFAPDSLWREGMEGDLGSLAKIAHRGKVASAYQVYLDQQTEAHVEQYWPYIQAVAAALLEKKTLSERKVWQVIAAVTS